MSSLHPSARRFVALALAQQGNQRQQTEWRVWADNPERELPPHLAQLALHALSGMALRIEDSVAGEATDPVEAAQLENDRGYRDSPVGVPPSVGWGLSAVGLWARQCLEFAS